MKITPVILHIPPHISTSWTQVSALYLKETDLIVTLLDGSSISIPGLSAETRDAIFSAYALYLEGQTPRPQERPVPFQVIQVTPRPHGNGGPIFSVEQNLSGMGFNMESIESISSAMQHNIAQANTPDLPKEILEKIASVAKIVAPDEIQNMPKPEPHCNCPHCQIARAIHQAVGSISLQNAAPSESEIKEEEVKDEELAFQQWNIQQTGDKLYTVSNRLDLQEHYSVYLGHPVGCTCGKEGCEHMLAVLKS